MQTLTLFFRKIGLEMQNHERWQNLSRKYYLKYLNNYSSDLPNQPKYLGYLKKSSYWVSIVHVPIQPSVWLDGLAVPFYKRKKDEKIWQKNEVPSLQRK